MRPSIRACACRSTNRARLRSNSWMKRGASHTGWHPTPTRNRRDDGSLSPSTWRNTVMKGNNNRFLVVYSGLLTAVFAVVVLTGATAPGKKAAFEEIDVQRLNLREPDGTLRYVLASSARLPGAIIRGQEYPHPRPQAGMLFYNDEETELGGLVFAGGQDEDGVIRSGGSLTFDRYEQDQIVQLLGLD